MPLLVRRALITGLLSSKFLWDRTSSYSRKWRPTMHRSRLRLATFSSDGATLAAADGQEELMH
jgi:hypothetical protein